MKRLIIILFLILFTYGVCFSGMIIQKFSGGAPPVSQDIILMGTSDIILMGTLDIIF